MTVALTATPLEGLAAIRVEVTGLLISPVVVTRTDVNGTQPVRLAPDQEPISGTLIVVDHDVSLSGTVLYTCEGASAELEWRVPFPVLAVVGRPNQRAHLTAVTGYAENTSSTAAAVPILDRDDKLVLEQPHTLPDGSLVAWCGSYADALTVAAIARTGRPVLFRQPDYPGMDKYATFVASAIAPDTVGEQQRWTVRLDYLTRFAPDTPLTAAAGWDFDEVLAAFDTFDALALTFPSFDALTVGP